MKRVQGFGCLHSEQLRLLYTIPAKDVYQQARELDRENIGSGQSLIPWGTLDLEIRVDKVTRSGATTIVLILIVLGYF